MVKKVKRSRKVLKRSTNVNKINIRIGNLPESLGILPGSVGNFGNISKGGSTNKNSGSQSRLLTQQAHYGGANIRYIQAIPGYSTIGLGTNGDNQNFGVSKIPAINPNNPLTVYTNPKGIEPIYKSIVVSNEVPKISKIFAPQIYSKDLNYELDNSFNALNINKGDFMKPQTASSSLAQFIPRTGDIMMGRTSGTFAEQGIDPAIDKVRPVRKIVRTEPGDTKREY